MNKFVKNLAELIALPQSIDFWMKQFNVNYLTTSPTAKVVSKQSIGDAIKLVLSPSKSFGEFAAGQHIRLKMPIDFINVERCYSIANLPNSKRLIELYIKVQGQVSEAIKNNLSVGQVVEISKPFGENIKRSFDTFVAGGIGITAMWPLFKAQAEQQQKNVKLLYLTRLKNGNLGSDGTAKHTVLFDEIKNSRWFKRGQVEILDGRNQLNNLDGLQNQFATSERVISCGSSGFNSKLKSQLLSANVQVELFQEDFASTAERSSNVVPELEKTFELSLVKSKDRLMLSNQKTLLEGLLEAGKQVRYGCKQGICQECICTVADRSVANGEPKQIQLCTTFANKNLELMI